MKKRTRLWRPGLRKTRNRSKRKNESMNIVVENQTNCNTILEALNVLLDKGKVYELRTLRSGETGSGYYTDFETMARDAARLSGSVDGVYFTLNPVDPELLARSPNRYRPRVRHGETTTDAQVVERRLLFIDADPERLSGISATDEEKAAAYERIETVHTFLSEQGFPGRLFADSGNGYHIDYRLQLPNDQESKNLVQSLLAALKKRFSDVAVKIDSTVFNAARICKLYGTLSCKGKDMPSRPHRLSKILEVSDDFRAGVVVPPAAIERVIAALGQEHVREVAASVVETAREEYERLTRQVDIGPAGFDVRAFIDQYGLGVYSEGPYEEAYKWALDHCPFNPSHVEGSCAFFQSNDWTQFACSHDSCTGLKWAALAKKYDLPTIERHPPKPNPHDFLIDLKGHCAVKRSFDWIIEGALYQGGLFVLAGEPGAGKSVFLLQTMLDTLYGAKVFDGRATSPRPLIYLDWDGGSIHYEHQRDIALQGRDIDEINHLYRYGTSTPEPPQQPLETYLSPAYLELAVQAFPEQKGTIVVDCLRSAFCQTPALVDNWENNNGAMYQLVGGLRNWCHKSGWTVILLHHKSRAGNVAGAFGIEGASDVVWDFERHPGQTQAKLIARRRLPRELVLEFDYVDDLYVFAGQPKEVLREYASQLKRTIATGIVECLKDADPDPVSGNRIDVYLRKVRKLTYDDKVFRKMLNTMCQTYNVIRRDGGRMSGCRLAAEYDKRLAEYLDYLLSEVR